MGDALNSGIVKEESGSAGEALAMSGRRSYEG
jgi:hypothetical protein